jgi:hypothetical protein
VVLAVVCLAFRAQAEDDVYKVRPAVDIPIIAGTSAAIIVPYSLSSSIINFRCPCDPNELNRLDRHAVGNNNGTAETFSNITAGLAVAAPYVVDLIDVGWNRTLLDDSIVVTEALTVNGAVATMFKFSVQRPIPKLYAGQAPDQLRRVSGYDAFYSGHTSTTFAALSAMSMTLTLRHGFSIWPWLATAVVGTSVAVERVAAGQHFYTDVIVGAFMGTAIGVLVPWLHASSRSGLPTVSADSGAVVVGWRRAW